jgi:glucose/mannose-6-phosphate isomerase
MHISDHSNFYKFICDFPNQINKSAILLKGLKLKSIGTQFDSIVLNGMGGSAIAGDLLAAYLKHDLTIPFFVNRNYNLPDFVGQNTLVIYCSYSGNTEETLFSFNTAIEKKAHLIAITSGGKLAKLTEQYKIPFIKIPGGYPPRQALGYMYFPLLHLLHRLGLVKIKQKDIDETIEVTKELRQRNHPDKDYSHHLSNHLAQQLYRKVPIIYCAADVLAPVVIRWRNQFNENSKVLAFSNILPELNHNEIMGWEAPREILRNFHIIFLRDPSEFPRNKKRLEITKEIFHGNHLPVAEIFGEGKSLLSRIFSLIYIGDWVSYYLALFYDKDPYKIESINYLKEKLSKYKEYSGVE